MADKLEVRAHIQSYFNRLERWTDGHLFKFNKVRFGLPTLGRDMQQVHWGLMARELPCEAESGNFGRQQVEQKSSACPCSNEGQAHSGQH